MLAGQFTGNKEIWVTNVPDPEPSKGRVLVRVGSTGFCGSDLRNYHATKPQKREPVIQGQ